MRMYHHLHQCLTAGGERKQIQYKNIRGVFISLLLIRHAVTKADYMNNTRPNISTTQKHKNESEDENVSLVKQ